MSRRTDRDVKNRGGRGGKETVGERESGKEHRRKKTVEAHDDGKKRRRRNEEAGAHDDGKKRRRRNEETGYGESREPKKQRKRRKKKNYFLNFLLAVLVVVGLYFIATSSLFSIDTFSVESSGDHFTDTEIAVMSGVKSGDNLWKTRTGRAEDRLEKNPYIESAEVERKPPGTIAITIKEREENYALAVGDRFAILDWSGMVLRTVGEPPELPLIEGIETEKAVTGSAVKASRELLLADAVKLVEDTEKNGLYFKRVVVTEVNVKAYIYDTLSVRGKLESVGSNLEKVKLVVLDLNKQKIVRGTIIVGDSGNCTFSPEEQ